MAWLLQNWVFVLFMAAFIAMQLFSHGGHGGHGRRGGHGGHGRRPGETDGDSALPDGSSAASGAGPTGHQH